MAPAGLSGCGASGNDPHSEPAAGMLEGVFTQSIGIVPIFAWRASARW